MISLDRASYQVQPRYAEYVGLSTDVKPVESIDNGDEFQEIDTGFVYKFDETNSEWVKQPTGGGGGAIDDNTISTGTTWSSRMIVDSLAPSFEISGPVVTCNPVPGYPLSVVSQIVPVQEGTGDPSPENVRPITGWTEANLQCDGVNILKTPYADGAKITRSGITFTVEADGTVVANGTATGLSYFILTNNLQAKKDITYYISGCPIGGSSETYSIRSVRAGHNDTGAGVSATGKSIDRIQIQVKEGTVCDNIVFRPMVTVLANQKPESYRGKTITLPFGQTVYGGTLDWTTGVLTVNAAYLQLTSESEITEYSFIGSKGVAFNSILNISENRANGISSHAVIDAVGMGPDAYPGGSLWIGVTNNSIYWINILDVLGMQTIYDFKLWLDTQNVQVVYEIQEPLTIQLTPQEILALSGVNTIYTDTGDTTVSGRADPTTIINQLAARIAALESAATNI